MLVTSEEGENGDEAVEKFASGAQEGKICVHIN